MDYKTIEVAVRLVFPHGTKADQRFCELSVRDQASRKLVATVQLKPEELFAMLANQEAHGHAKVANDFDDFGKILETKAVLIESESLKNCSRADLDRIIEVHRIIFDVDGWRMQPLGGSLSRDQHNSQAGTLAVISRRYVDVKPTEEEV